MFNSQPGRGSSCVPNYEHMHEQQNRSFAKARRSALSKPPSLKPARVPPARTIEVPKAPSCLQVGRKRSRDEGGPGASQAAADTAPATAPSAAAALADPKPEEGAVVGPSAAAPAAAAEVTSLVAYGDSDGEDSDGDPR